MRNHRRRSALLLAAVATLVPICLVSAPAAAAEGCSIESGTMTWGVKESFRSYISGSIAKGSWEATAGATYETPSFTFAGASGEIDAATGAGTIAFAGTVHFTGHGGVLDMTLASPSIVIAEDGTATLQLDVRSTDTSGAPAVDEKQAEVGALGEPIVVDASAGTAAVADAPAVLTDAGAPAFGGFYEAGDELDPVTVDVQLSCPTADSETSAGDSAADETPAAEAPEAGTETPEEETPGESAGWVPFAIGGGAVVAIAAATGGFLIARRRRRG
ncbi:HtaA domain-containing protein [Microbacterium suwonense]|uniref:Htaa domain-containing protein n=1 Tax=Microbacterium suwonense TaxID=683047 RepID=A0ABM8FUF1_9MICO|nr:HtaA domain-containing protein [Microbacterium suwonense]BDZ39107.1 hypothetical protein GCM10025863_17210 [Microbacterium suwonense]